MTLIAQEDKPPKHLQPIYLNEPCWAGMQEGVD